MIDSDTHQVPQTMLSCIVNLWVYYSENKWTTSLSTTEGEKVTEAQWLIGHRMPTQRIREMYQHTYCSDCSRCRLPSDRQHCYGNNSNSIVTEFTSVLSQQNDFFFPKKVPSAWVTKLQFKKWKLNEMTVESSAIRLKMGYYNHILWHFVGLHWHWVIDFFLCYCKHL